MTAAPTLPKSISSAGWLNHQIIFVSSRNQRSDLLSKCVAASAHNYRSGATMGAIVAAVLENDITISVLRPECGCSSGTISEQWRAPSARHCRVIERSHFERSILACDRDGIARHTKPRSSGDAAPDSMKPIMFLILPSTLARSARSTCARSRSACVTVSPRSSMLESKICSRPGEGCVGTKVRSSVRPPAPWTRTLRNCAQGKVHAVERRFTWCQARRMSQWAP